MAGVPDRDEVRLGEGGRAADAGHGQGHVVYAAERIVVEVLDVPREARPVLAGAGVAVAEVPVPPPQLVVGAEVGELHQQRPVALERARRKVNQRRRRVEVQQVDRAALAVVQIDDPPAVDARLGLVGGIIRKPGLDHR